MARIETIDGSSFVVGGRPLFDFFCQWRYRIRWQMFLCDVVRVAFWTAVLCIPLMVFRARLGLRADILWVLCLVTTGAIASAIGTRRHIDIAGILARLDLSADGGDFVASGADFLTDSDPFRRLALRKGEEWLVGHSNEITSRRRWPFEWKLLPIALLLLVMASVFIAGLAPTRTLAAKHDEANVDALPPTSTGAPPMRQGERLEAETTGRSGARAGAGRQEQSAIARGSGASATSAAGGGASAPDGSGNAPGAGGSSSGAGRSSGAKGSATRANASATKDNALAAGGGATRSHASGQSGAGQGDGTNAPPDGGRGGGRSSSTALVKSGVPDSAADQQAAQSATSKIQRPSEGKNAASDTAASSGQVESPAGGSLTGATKPSVTGRTAGVGNDSRMKEKRPRSDAQTNIKDVAAKRPNGVAAVSREQIVDAPLDAPDAILESLGPATAPADFGKADLDPSELELLPPRRRAALLRFFGSRDAASTQPTR